MSQSQTISLGERSLLSMGSNSSFFVGGNTQFKGELKNEGTIIGYGDLDFVDNTDIGRLILRSETDQEIRGGSLAIDEVEVNSSAVILIDVDTIRVEGNFDVVDGVIQTTETSSIVVKGIFNPGGGLIEGTIIGYTKDQPITFPMGVGGFANYISLGNTVSDLPLIVTCQVPPDLSQLLPTEEMIGIADEVEWIIQTQTDSTEALISVDYSGLDFLNFSNGRFINADVYEPALVVFQNGDTIYQALASLEATPRNIPSSETSGRIVSSTPIMIGPEPTKIAIAWIPVVDDPEFFVPNAFSPSAFEEENRVFRPFFSGGEVSSISMAIYDSFNKNIFSYTDSGEDLDLSSIGWDGKAKNGQNAVEGVYYYSIHLIADGQNYKKTSAVLLTN